MLKLQFPFGIVRCRKSEYSLGAVVGNCGKLLDYVSWGV